MNVGPIFLPTACPEECEALEKCGHTTVNKVAQQISITINVAFS